MQAESLILNTFLSQHSQIWCLMGIVELALSWFQMVIVVFWCVGILVFMKSVSDFLPSTVRTGYQQHLHPVHAKSTTSISPCLIMAVPIHALPAFAANRDFPFKPNKLDYVSLFSHMVNAEVKGILVKNDTNSSVIIPQNSHLGHLQEMGICNSMMLEGSRRDCNIMKK